MPYIVREQSGTKNIVIMRYAALFYWLMWPTLIVSVYAWLSDSSGFMVAAAVLWVSLTGTAMPYWPTVYKLKKIMKGKSLVASGSKYSFRNPLRYEWDD